MPDAFGIFPAMELGCKNSGTGAGTENAQVEYKNQLVHNGNAAHGQGPHLAHHNIVQQGYKICNAVLDDDRHGNLEHALVKGPIANISFQHKISLK